MKIIPVKASTDYNITIANKLLSTNVLSDYCSHLKKRIVIITDSNLVESLAKKLQKILLQQNTKADLFSFPAGEIHKTRETKQILEDNLLSKNYGRDTCLIAIGGGVVTDMVGFVAATYCRGIPVIYIPTSLLAMVDAGIGGKTGVNTPHGKNLIGTFTQPQVVLIDTDVLQTLPDHEWRNGIVEIIKHSLIADADFFCSLQDNNNIKKFNARDAEFLENIIYASSLIKKNIVEQDEKEQVGIRQLLNFGHTIGHAIETIENYAISHGEAVAIGILVESYLSVKSGFLSQSNLDKIYHILSNYSLPLKTIAFEDKNKILLQKLLSLDKKSINNIPQFVLLDDIGKPHRHHGAYAMPVDAEQITQALDWAAENFVRQ